MPELSGYLNRRDLLVAQQLLRRRVVPRVTGVLNPVLLIGAAYLISEGCRLLSLGLQPAGYAGATPASAQAGAVAVALGVMVVVLVVARSAGRGGQALDVLAMDRTRAARALPAEPGTLVGVETPWDARDDPFLAAVARRERRADAYALGGPLVLAFAAVLAVWWGLRALLLIPSRSLWTSVLCCLLAFVLETVVAYVALRLAWLWLAKSALGPQVARQREALLLRHRADARKSGRRISPGSAGVDGAAGWWAVPAAILVGTPILMLVRDVPTAVRFALGMLGAVSILQALLLRWNRRPHVESSFEPEPGAPALVTETRDTVRYEVTDTALTIHDAAGRHESVVIAWADVIGVRTLRMVIGGPPALALLHEVDSMLLFGEDVADRVVAAYATTVAPSRSA